MATKTGLDENRQNFGVSFQAKRIVTCSFAKRLKIGKIVGAQRRIAKVDPLQTFWDPNLEVLSGPELYGARFCRIYLQTSARSRLTLLHASASGSSLKHTMQVVFVTMCL